MMISGYSAQYLEQIISGAINRYSEMLRNHDSGVKPLYRNRKGIMETKRAKGGKSTASWFLKGKTRQVLNVPPTPGAILAKQIQHKLKDFEGPDKGSTKAVERAGKRVTMGLPKDDPFSKVGCIYE